MKKHHPKKIKEYVTKLNWFTKKYDPEFFNFLGSGNFGAVFESKRLKDKQIVALKYIETCNYSEYEKTFDEVKILKKLSHPNILKIYDECFMTEPLDDDNDEEDEKNEEDNKNLYKLIIVSERAAMSLKQYMQKKNVLKENEILHIFSDLVQALIFSKEKRIFHCDIKPDNILVFEGNRDTSADLQKLFVEDPKLIFKLCDWGGASNLERSRTITRIKSDEKMAFTWAYASPEITDVSEDKSQTITSEKKIYFFKCDIFSLAITVLVLCGVPVKTLLNMSRAESYPIDLKAIFDKFIQNKYPKFLGDLLYKMLAFQNEKRISILEVSEILKKNSSLPSPQKKELLSKSQIKTMDDDEHEEEMTLEKKMFSKEIFSNKYPMKMDPTWENFVEKLMDQNEIASTIVKNAMLRVNRKNFVLNEKDALEDTPKAIGWANTVSQPTMQALTLNLLCPFLVNAKKALDIGTGSGYISACMAEIMGPQRDGL